MAVQLDGPARCERVCTGAWRIDARRLFGIEAGKSLALNGMSAVQVCQEMIDGEQHSDNVRTYVMARR